MSRRQHEPEEPENHELWLISYADFITLLFAFFVVMFASSQADKSKAQRVSDSVSAAFDGKHASSLVAAILGGVSSYARASDCRARVRGYCGLGAFCQRNTD